MIYNLNNLMTLFKHLGGYVDSFGYAWTDEAFDDFDVYGHFASIDIAKLRLYYGLKAQLPNADLKLLRTEFEKKHIPIVNDLNERYLRQQSNYAMAIFYFVKSIKDLKKFDIHFEDVVTTQQIEELFVSLGGTIEGTTYNIDNKPVKIQEIELEITRLENELKTIIDPIQKQPEGVVNYIKYKLKAKKHFTKGTQKHKRYQIVNITDKKQDMLIKKVFSKIDYLKGKLEDEIKQNPEYAKVHAVFETIQQMISLNQYISANQHIKI